MMAVWIGVSSFCFGPHVLHIFQECLPIQKLRLRGRLNAFDALVLLPGQQNIKEHLHHFRQGSSVEYEREMWSREMRRLRPHMWELLGLWAFAPGLYAAATQITTAVASWDTISFGALRGDGVLPGTLGLSRTRITLGRLFPLSVERNIK